jgi:uncharacterized membrane protein
MAAKAKQAADQSAGDAQESATDTADQATSAPGDAASAADQTNGLFSELKDTAAEAALAVLKPAVKSAAQSAASYAVNKGPDLVKDKLDDVGGLDDLANKALSNAGPVGKVASKLGMGGKLVDNVLPGGDDDDEDGGEAEAEAVGSGRRMPVQQSMDVAVPLEVAYNQWTQFEEYPNFMFRVDSASQDDDAHVTFTEKVWGFGREFEAEIVEQRPNERIVWRSVNGLKHAGVVTFHELSERLTHIEVTVDFKPESLFQKFARGTRFSKRAIRADMHRFKAYIEMTEEAEGSWLGRIEDGEVVQSHEEAEQERAAEEEGEEQPEAEGEGEQAEAEGEEQPQAEEEEQPEAEEEESPEAEGEEEPEAEEEGAPEAEEEQPQAEEEPEAEEEAEPEAEEKPARRRTAQRARKPRGSDGRQPAQGRSRPSAQGGRSGSKRRSPQRPKQPQRRTASSSAR